MLPLLPANPSLEDTDNEAERPKQYGYEKTNKSRHHRIPRTTFALEPLLEESSRRRIFNLIVQI